eukprot:168791-Pyramimonas_sp.AAC.1
MYYPVSIGSKCERGGEAEFYHPREGVRIQVAILCVKNAEHGNGGIAISASAITSVWHRYGILTS